MVLSNSDVSMTYSGGASNTDPDLSLGGEASAYPIAGNRLFNDISQPNATNGITDYRCFYFKNSSNVDTLYDARALISYDVPGDVTVQVGFNFQNDRQNITVANYASVSSGSLVLTYTDTSDHDVTVSWNASTSTWATNFQTALRTISKLEDVTVAVSISGSSAVFEVNFVGVAAKRLHNLIVLKTNNLSPSQTVTVTRIIEGGPINQTADVIDVSTTSPIGITFNATTNVMGDIRPQDIIPIWIKRTVPANSTAIEDDGFTFQVQGKGIDPNV